MTPTVAWIFLVTSGLIDVAWAFTMKKADGFSNPAWSVISLILLAAFVFLLTKSLQVLPLGTAYAVWTGIGAVGSVTVGILFFGEPFSIMRVMFVTVTLIGIIGLKVTAS